MSKKPYDPYETNYKNLQAHPHQILLILTLMGLTMMFFMLSMAYLYQRYEKQIPPIQLPVVFLLNTIFLVLSSYTLHRAKLAYLADQTEKYKFQLLLTLTLTIIFMIAQLYGWIWMRQNGLFPNTGPNVAYIYALAGLHFLHVAVGIPIFMIFLRVAVKRMKEPVSVLIYFSDPEKKLRLRLLSIYWHFLDILWLYLVLIFMIF